MKRILKGKFSKRFCNENWVFWPPSKKKAVNDVIDNKNLAGLWDFPQGHLQLYRQ